jgi:hypothetical protein
MKYLAKQIILVGILMILAGCATPPVAYHDTNMDFSAIRTIAVMPFSNLSRDAQAGDRLRDVFSYMLLATGSMYVVPSGEVARGVARSGIVNPATPSVEEIIKLGANLKVDAIITGVVREYGELRSASSEANVISVSLQMTEVQTGRIVWTASATRGGIGWNERLFGGGGEPMNKVTEQVVNDLLEKLFK